MKRLITLIILAGLAIMACKKNNVPVPPDNEKDNVLYFCGSVNRMGSGASIPCYWKDTAFVTLPIPDGAYGTANTIVQSNGNLYVSGSYNLNGNFVGCVWKNNIAEILPALPGYPRVSTSGMVISGNDIYVVGSCGNSVGSTIPVYWKNGLVTGITDAPEPDAVNAAYAIAVLANDVYLGGKIGKYTSAVADAASIWKNGVRSDLPIAHPSKWSLARSMTIDQGNIYAGGFAYDADERVMQAIIWKNGVGQELSTEGDGAVSEIAVKNSTVYAAGYFQRTFRGVTEPCFWKNNAIVSLTPLVTGREGAATGILLNNEDMYISGRGYDKSGNQQPLYWKNGELKQLKVTSIANGGSAEAVFMGMP